MSKKPKSGAAKRPKSKKTEVIEILFENIWPVGSNSPLKDPMVVTNDEVSEAIKERNKRHIGEKGRVLGPNNPANFLKDLIRKSTANANWPQRLKDMRITGRQVYGDALVLEFVPYGEKDDVPFPDRFEPPTGIPTVPIEALSLPRAARGLGRKDEAWLTQVVVYQRIIHHHLALQSTKNVVELSHLQMSVKTQPEIDAIFVATIEDAGSDLRALVTCEAKQYGERILENQIRAQIAQAFAFSRTFKGASSIDAIIPIAIQIVRYDVPGLGSRRGIYVIEFEMMTRKNFEEMSKVEADDMPLSAVSQAFYYLHPHVGGISDAAVVVEAADDDDDID